MVGRSCMVFVLAVAKATAEVEGNCEEAGCSQLDTFGSGLLATRRTVGKIVSTDEDRAAGSDITDGFRCFNWPRCKSRVNCKKGNKPQLLADLQKRGQWVSCDRFDAATGRCKRFMLSDSCESSTMDEERGWAVYPPSSGREPGAPAGSVPCPGAPAMDCPGGIFCPGPTSAEGCALQGTCAYPYQSWMKPDVQCPAVCPALCDADEMSCLGPDTADGCPGPMSCIESEFALADGETMCQSHCPLHCPGGEATCHGGVDHRGCPLPDTCGYSPFSISNPGVQCPSRCPLVCGPAEMVCPGDVDVVTGCQMLDTCHPMEHGCPLHSSLPAASDSAPVACSPSPEPHCGPDDVHCPGGTDEAGCPMPGICMPSKFQGVNGVECWNHCPAPCGPGDMICPGAVDATGCPMPGTCMPSKFPGMGGVECWNHCPAMCGPDEMLCPGANDPTGCPMPGTCMPSKSPGVGGVECWNHCPATCGSDEMFCPGGHDSAGCEMPGMCVPMEYGCPPAAFK